MVIPILIV
ncbi:hypothetical protein N499_0566A, partial [Wolbachia pipientis wVitA]